MVLFTMPRRVFIAIAAITFLSVARGSDVKEQKFDFLLRDSDSLLKYASPDSGASWTDAWNVTFADSNASNGTDGVIGLGESGHKSSRLGATVSIQWYGFGIEFLGKLDVGTVVQLFVDGKPAKYSPSKTSIIQRDDLDLGTHTATLVVTAGSATITGVKVTYGVLLNNADDVTQAIDSKSSLPYYAKGPDGVVSMNSIVSPSDSSLWNPNDNIGGGSGSPGAMYQRIGSNSQGASATITIPAGNVFLAVNGSNAWDHGEYIFKINPAVPGGETNRTLSGLNPFTVFPCTLYATPLDPTVSYRLTATVGKAGPVEKWFDLNSVTLYPALQGSGSGSKKGAPIGAIVGGVIGGVVVLGLAAFLIWWFVIRPKKTKHQRPPKVRREEDEDWQIDNEAAAVTPLPHVGTPTGDYSHQMMTRGPEGTPMSYREGSTPLLPHSKMSRENQYMASHGSSSSGDYLSQGYPYDSTSVGDTSEYGTVTSQESRQQQSQRSRNEKSRHLHRPMVEDEIEQETDGGSLRPVGPKKTLVPPVYGSWAPEPEDDDNDVSPAAPGGSAVPAAGGSSHAV